jgi:hypothetical protein
MRRVLCPVIFIATLSGIPACERFLAAQRPQIVGDNTFVFFFPLIFDHFTTTNSLRLFSMPS